MTSWIPQAVLANVTVSGPIDAHPVAFVRPDDARLERIGAAHPAHAEFLARFTDAFGQRVAPTVLIVEFSAPAAYRSVDAMASIRDILSICVVPRARARRIQGKGGNGVCYSTTFDFYPWMVARDEESLVASTPGLSAVHDVGCFVGQSAPEVSTAVVSPSDLDRPLFDALVERWRRAYGVSGASWEDTKLMRSLNMAFHACEPPADQGATVFDFGRVLALWVSALEILVHPGKRGTANESRVLEHLEGVLWHDGVCRDKARQVCRTMYRWRHRFLHGNSIDVGKARSLMTRDSLFGVAVALYRMALATFLCLRREEPADPDDLASEIAGELAFREYQRDFEAVIVRCRVG